MNRSAAVVLLGAACALAPLAGEAQKPESLTYRCIGKDKKTYYGQTPPSQCAGLPLEMLNAQGIVVKRVDPAAEAEQKALKQAEDAKKRQEEAAIKDRQRRDKALLATYTNDADIELARKRALLDNEKSVQEIDGRIASAKKRQAELAKEQEFFQGKNKPPAKLAQDIQTAGEDLKSLEAQREKRVKEVESINAKFDEDKRRYVELTRGTPAPAPAKGAPAKK
jgi:hypothetical protein